MSNSVKKFCLILELCHFKVQCLDITMKIGSLTTLLDCCEKGLFQKKLPDTSGGPIRHVDHVACRPIILRLLLIQVSQTTNN